MNLLKVEVGKGDIRKAECDALGLMFVEGELAVNAPMLEGMQRHERAHEGGSERRGETVAYRQVYVWSDRLRVAGSAELGGHPAHLGVGGGHDRAEVVATVTGTVGLEAVVRPLLSAARKGAR